MKRPPLFSHILTTGFGSGYCPIAPGTAGAVLAVLLWWLASLWMTPMSLFLTTLITIFIFTILGVVCTNQVIPFWGDDPHRVVVDEMVGVWIPLVVVQPGEWGYILASLALFRFFDIVKPLGVRKMETLPGGTGVMADDILAGIYSLVIILIVRWVL